ncbi:ubiquitin carboxyl-terminal hydrolase 17-like protein D [Acomys russatus]|uniref:ubiquitin carboxyl-terminal hydrolase 17-like protein D n=1 Tax=Acomys russatus TaxID=60746 RepID=UPI0021E2A724|nr:ubiquitin carboxyl-terminal hydrolase 17-like protein D [Acomys russatus]
MSPMSAVGPKSLCDLVLKAGPVAFSPAAVGLHQRKAQVAAKLVASGKFHGVGAGLKNIGNSCYLNAALQCLTHTPPLATYMLSKEHSQSCLRQEGCRMCAMEAHVAHSFLHSGDVMQPSQELTAAFHKYMQEDAHEFLMFTLNAMDESCLRGSRHSESHSQVSTPIQEIFGGSWRSQIKCLHCQATSDSLEPFLDIPLDICTAQSVTQALEELVKAEELCGENAYSCGSCREKMPASKVLTVQAAPKVLLLVLNRFSGFMGHKVDRKVSYPESLDLRPYMSQPKRGPLVYTLYAVLVHDGVTCLGGHYFCCVKAGNGKWYKMDDSSVTMCDVASVLSEPAYLLFYVQRTDLKRDNVKEPGSRVNQPLCPKSKVRKACQRKLNMGPAVEAAAGEERGLTENSATKEPCLDQQEALQEHNHPNPVPILGRPHPTLPANAVIIHQSRQGADVGRNALDKDNLPCPSSAKLLNAQGSMNTGQRCSHGGRQRSKKKKNKKQGWRLLVAY